MPARKVHDDLTLVVGPPEGPAPPAGGDARGPAPVEGPTPPRTSVRTERQATATLRVGRAAMVTAFAATMIAMPIHSCTASS